MAISYCKIQEFQYNVLKVAEDDKVLAACRKRKRDLGTEYGVHHYESSYLGKPRSGASFTGLRQVHAGGS